MSFTTRVSRTTSASPGCSVWSTEGQSASVLLRGFPRESGSPEKCPRPCALCTALTIAAAHSGRPGDRGADPRFRCHFIALRQHRMACPLIHVAHAWRPPAASVHAGNCSASPITFQRVERECGFQMAGGRSPRSQLFSSRAPASLEWLRIQIENGKTSLPVCNTSGSADWPELQSPPKSRGPFCPDAGDDNLDFLLLRDLPGCGRRERRMASPL